MADMEADDIMESWAEECHQLLMGLKCTVERLLAVQTSNVWSTYGGFKRVSSHLEAILCHRIKPTQMFSPTDGIFWPFVRGLKWLRPGMTSTMEQVSRSSRLAGQGGIGQMWLRESLQDHSLSSQLEILVSDAEHLHYHYQEGAFLRSADYVEAMLICLHAVESNRVAGLAEINPRLPQQRWSRLSVVSEVSSAAGSVRSSSTMEHSLSFEEHAAAKTPSIPDLASSPLYRAPAAPESYGTQGEGIRFPDQASTTPAAFATSATSTPPSLSFFIGSGPSPSSSSPDMGGFYTRMQSDPLMAVEYGSSPPLRRSSPASLQNSGEVFTSVASPGETVTRSPLKKCLSDSFSPPDEDSETDVSQTVSDKSGVMVTQKKMIHIPGKSGKNDPAGGAGSVGGSGNDRRASSETKKVVGGGGGVKGHKRSQSDMGVRANGVAVMNGGGGCQDDRGKHSSTDRPAAHEGGDKTLSRSQKYRENRNGLQAVGKYPSDRENRNGLQAVGKYPSDRENRNGLQAVGKYPSDRENRNGLQAVGKYPSDRENRNGLQAVGKYPSDRENRNGLQAVGKYPSDRENRNGLQAVGKYPSDRENRNGLQAVGKYPSDRENRNGLQAVGKYPSDRENRNGLQAVGKYPSDTHHLIHTLTQ
ncbi:hypothetical protein ACOMHN_039562 [Nucella lapillus]